MLNFMIPMNEKINNNFSLQVKDQPVLNMLFFLYFCFDFLNIVCKKIR
jgi:hypothetical protein